MASLRAFLVLSMTGFVLNACDSSTSSPAANTPNTTDTSAKNGGTGTSSTPGWTWNVAGQSGSATAALHTFGAYNLSTEVSSGDTTSYSPVIIITASNQTPLVISNLSLNIFGITATSYSFDTIPQAAHAIGGAVFQASAGNAASPACGYVFTKGTVNLTKVANSGTGANPDKLVSGSIDATAHAIDSSLASKCPDRPYKATFTDVSAMFTAS